MRGLCKVELNKTNKENYKKNIQEILSQKGSDDYAENIEFLQANLCINSKQYIGLGFFDFQKFPLPNLFSKSRIFCNYYKRNRPIYHGENIAHKNTNFNVFSYGYALSNDDFRKFYSTLAIYLNETNFCFGEEIIIDIKDICEILNLKFHGENPKLIYNTLKTLAENRYVIDVFGKKRKQIIYKIGHKVPFSFVKKLELLENNKIKIAFDARIALLFLTAKNDLNGNIIYKTNQKTETVTLQSTYGIYDLKFIKQNNKLKSFGQNIYMETLATNNYKQRINLNTLKENYAYKSTIAQIKHKFGEYINNLNEIVTKCTEISKNIFEIENTTEKRERLVLYFGKKFLQIQENYEKGLLKIGKEYKNSQQHKFQKEKLKLSYEKAMLQLEKQLKRNGIENREIYPEFCYILNTIKREQKERKKSDFLQYSKNVLQNLKNTLNNTFTTFLPDKIPI